MHYKQRGKLFRILDAYALGELDFDETWSELEMFSYDLKTASQRNEFLKVSMLNFVMKAQGEGAIDFQKANQCVQEIIEGIRNNGQLSVPGLKTKSSLDPQSDFSAAVKAVKREVKQPGYLLSAEFK